jgi:LmbE family N-acetylglucosaminyl deacetylase
MMSRAFARTEPLRITGPLLVVSPHFDDVPLSCEALVARPTAMTVLHVCAARPSPAISTDWDRQSGFSSSDESAAARRAEEHAAFAGTPHTFIDVDVLDGQYTGLPRTDEDHRRVTEAVAAWIDEVGGPCTVAAPVGAGRRHDALVPLVRLRNLVTKAFLSSEHPDHLLARDATIAAVLDRPQTDLLLYEELPYRLTRRGDAAAARVLDRLGPGSRLVCTDLPVDRPAKARRLRAYASQLPLLFPASALADDERFARFLPGDERYWRVVRG